MKSEHGIRFRLFRLRRKGWGFAFNANADVQGDVNDFLPAFDEFVKAVFGVHGAQVVKDLKAIEKWTDPKTSLPELFGDAGVEFGKKLLQDVTGVDPESAFNTARDRLVALVDNGTICRTRSRRASGRWSKNRPTKQRPRRAGGRSPHRDAHFRRESRHRT